MTAKQSNVVNGVDLGRRLGLIGMALHDYRWALGGALEEGDLFSAGFIGLRRAALKFDAARGAFSTYAMYWIRQSIRRTVVDQRRTVRVPAWAQDAARKRGEMIPLDALSLDAPSRPGDPESDTPLDRMGVDDDPTAALEAEQQNEFVAQLLRGLPERAQDIIRARFWTGLTLAQIADPLGLSRERIRQIEVEALKQLRQRAKDRP